MGRRGPRNPTGVCLCPVPGTQSKEAKAFQTLLYTTQTVGPQIEGSHTAAHQSSKHGSSILYALGKELKGLSRAIQKIARSNVFLLCFFLFFYTNAQARHTLSRHKGLEQRLLVGMGLEYTRKNLKLPTRPPRDPPIPVTTWLDTTV